MNGLPRVGTTDRRDDLTYKIDQTIFQTDPSRNGNCFAACVATALGKQLADVPHFVEWGQHLHNGAIRDDNDPDRKHWWGMFLGYAFAIGLWPQELDTLEEAGEGEVVFVAGPSPRGVFHQVLYRDGTLWHDPHPSRAGLTSITEMFVLRPVPAPGHDHDPSEPA